MKQFFINIQFKIQKIVQIEPGEGHALLWSFSYFFALLCSYYIIRPIRDEMGIIGGIENLQWLFTGTLGVMIAVVPIFGWISSRYPRSKFLPYIYIFFIFMLLLFYILLKETDHSTSIARIFFIWVSVFNLFVVSVFWSFMTDLYNNEQARRLFGFIAAGGTAGALTGPVLTVLLVQQIGTQNLLLVSALFLIWAIVCINRLSHWSRLNELNTHKTTDFADFKIIGGSIWAGIRLVFRSSYLLGICMLMLLFTTLATFLYFMQAQIILDAFTSSEERTAVFALIDFGVNSLTLILQIFLTSRLIKWFGIAVVLAIIPVLLAIGFSLLSFAPVLMVLLVVQSIRRAGNYAIMRPVREMLYVVLNREEKYKAKNFIDTTVYRTGDAVSAWVYAGMRSTGMNLSTIALIAVPLALLWGWIAFGLGRHQVQIADKMK